MVENFFKCLIVKNEMMWNVIIIMWNKIMFNLFFGFNLYFIFVNVYWFI